MYDIRILTIADRDFWFTLDKHISQKQFEKKVADGMGYVIFEKNQPVGILRYNLFWDCVPFCTMLFVDWHAQRKGYGGALMRYWEDDMKRQGYKMLMTSTQVDETAQEFYRKMGYQDAGCLVLTVPAFAQPMEMFFVKGI